MTFRQEVERILTEFLVRINVNYIVPLEMECDELRRKNIQLNNNAIRYKKKYNELKSMLGDDTTNYRDIAIKLKEERDMYKRMYLEEKNRK